MTKQVLLSWSSGKDSAFSLHVLRNDRNVHVVGLLTTVNAAYNRVAMHSTRRTLLEAQARAVGLSLHVVDVPHPCSNAAYETAMGEAMRQAAARGVTHVASGDLFLDDVRQYRIDQLKGTGIKPLFPIWGQPTRLLAGRMIRNEIRAVVTCVDPNFLSRDLAGRWFDAAFLDDLPEHVDPCGENGEFHTCVIDGPEFAEPLDVVLGDVVDRDGFVFADVSLRDA